MSSILRHRSFLLGYDIGSSSVKAALVDADTHEAIEVVQSPQDAMPIHSLHQGWAEQDPEMWWSHLCIATKELLRKSSVDPQDIKGMGIAYQMHGLVCVDKNQNVLRPAIIWCDSRAVHIGNNALDILGQERCFTHLLNAPGNFTASKLRWVKEYEPEIYDRITKVMLPGDYIAMKLTGEIMTTPAGLSEGMLWNYINDDIAEFVLDHYGIDPVCIPDITPVFSQQGSVHDKGAKETGLAIGTPVVYRAGDQHNNAMSVGVLHPGDIAASGGTSGVVYGVVDKLTYDAQSRINSFMHVNHTVQLPRIGVLLCINGAGSQYNWVKQHVAQSAMTYEQMEKEASSIPAGSDDLRVLPFGNGTERMLGNIETAAAILHLDFNRHTTAHLYRAALEGIAFAFVHGVKMMEDIGVGVHVIRVGNDNLFQSEIFSSVIATLLKCRIDVIQTTGAVGAAKAAGVATGIYNSPDDAFHENKILRSYEPAGNANQMKDAFLAWEKDLNTVLL